VTVQHFDFKANLDVQIRKEYPNLAAKTTYLYVGFYANNLANFPSAKLFTTPYAYGAYYWLNPVPRTAVYPSAGDVTVNVGVVTKAILEQRSKTLTKYVGVIAESINCDEMMAMWVCINLIMT
jgi:hypothetical protein